MRMATRIAIALIAVVLGVWYGVNRVGVTPGGGDLNPAPEKTAMQAGPDAAQAPVEVEAVPGSAREVVPRDPPGAPDASPVALLLVDAATGEPVPHLRVELATADGAREALATDATGRLASALAYPAGPIDVHLVGNAHPDDILQTSRREAKAVPTSVPHVHAPAAATLEVALEVPAGPTFPLRVVLPPDYQWSDLLALYTSADPGQAFDKLYCVVRSEDGPWVRFSPLARLVGGAPELVVHVGTSDGLWHGKAAVTATTGIQPILAVDLRPSGAVRGRVLDPDGEPLARQWVRMKRTDPRPPEDPPARSLLALTEEDGSYLRRWMELGPYSFEVKREGCVTFQNDIVVTPGMPTVVDVALESDGGARDGTIRGRVTSRTGRYSAEVLVVLVQPTEAGWNRTTGVVWAEEDGNQVGRFAFEGLADADYVVAFHAPDMAKFDPEPAEVRPSDEELEFVVREHAPTDVTPLVFRVTDARTGEVLRTYEPFLDVNPGTPETRGKVPEILEDGRAVWADYPVDSAFEYIVTCAGYQPAWGDDFDMRLDGDEFVIEVALVPGWGTDVRVFGPDDARLAGASIFFDGVEAGTTDEDGSLHAALPTTPLRVRVSLDGWHMADDDGSDPNGIPFRAWPRFLSVRMARDAPGP